MIPAGRVGKAIVAGGLGVCLLVASGGTAEAEPRGRRAHMKQASSSEVEEVAPGWERRAGRYERLRARDAFEDPALLMILTSPGKIMPGSNLTLTVRLNGSPPRGRYASLSLGVDPSVLEFMSFEPTGDGALIIEPYPGQPGVLTIYRSSLSDGFSTSEDLAVLHFSAVRSGESIVVPSEVRLLDRKAEDMPVTYFAGEVYVE